MWVQCKIIQVRGISNSPSLVFLVFIALKQDFVSLLLHHAHHTANLTVFIYILYLM